MSDANIELLAPIIARVRTDTCCVKKPGMPPARIKQPLTPEKLAKHLNGGPVYGAYVMQPRASTTRIALFDFDSHKGESTWTEMQAAALRVLVAANTVGLRANAFRSSGGSGIHLIFMWEDDQDAYSVRAVMREVLESVGFREGNIGGIAAGNVEIFPKQDIATEFGHMFVLPLGGKSVPLDAFELDDMPRYGAIDWQMSDTVAQRERPERTAIAAPVVPVVHTELVSALDAIPQGTPQEPDRDVYLKLVFGTHHATHGSPEGYAIAQAFAARSATFSQEKFDNDWKSARSNRDGATATFQTIKNIAKGFGWEEPIADDFEAIEPSTDPQARPARPSYRRTDKGEILAIVENVVKGLSDPWECGVHIRFDEFRAEIMLAQRGTAEWRSLTDADYTRLQIRLEQQSFKKLSKEMMRDAVWLVADDDRFDSAIEWLQTLEWDGVPRIEGFLRMYMGTVDSPYTRAVSRYLWTALAGRVMQPGVKADMAPVFIGAQGAGKTSAVSAMAPAVDFFTELNLADRDVESSRRMRGRLVVELGELRGLHSRDAESIKAFISRTHEEWRSLYKEFNTVFPRRFVFFGTTNREEFLADDTGERRWLPVRVGKCDVAGVSRDRLQMWAEARETFELVGVEWQDAEKLAIDVHSSHKIQDAWTPVIEAWLDADDAFDTGCKPRSREFLQAHEVLVEALRLEPKSIGTRDLMRVGEVLRVLGFVKADKRVGKRVVKVWYPE